MKTGFTFTNQDNSLYQIASRLVPFALAGSLCPLKK